MEMQFYFKEMDSSDALRDYAELKIRDKVSKLSSKPVMAHVTFSLQPPKRKIHLHLHAGDGVSSEVEIVDEDMYAAIDKMVDTLEEQLRRQKEILKDHRNIFARASKLGDLFRGPYSRLVRFGKNVATRSAQPMAAAETGEIPIDASELLKLEAARLHVFHEKSQGAS
jgi:ribosomal subunit interface protein